MSIPSQEEMQRWYEATGRAPSDLWEAINRYVVTCGGNPSEHVYGNVPRMQAVVDVERAVTANAARHLAAEILGYVICDAQMAQASNAYKVMTAIRGVLGDETHRRHACESVARFGNAPTNDPVPRCHVCGDEVPADARSGLDLGAEPEDAKFCEPCIEVAEDVDMDRVEAMTPEQVADELRAAGGDPEAIGREGAAIVEAELARRAAVGKAVDGGE